MESKKVKKIKEEKAPQEVVATGPKYDPKKAYRWSNHDNLYLNGAEFGAVLNSLKSIANSELSQSVQVILRTASILEGVLARNVESGLIKEDVKPEEPPVKKEEPVVKQEEKTEAPN